MKETKAFKIYEIKKIFETNNKQNTQRKINPSLIISKLTKSFIAPKNINMNLRTSSTTENYNLIQQTNNQTKLILPDPFINHGIFISPTVMRFSYIDVISPMKISKWHPSKLIKHNTKLQRIKV